MCITGTLGHRQRRCVRRYLCSGDPISFLADVVVVLNSRWMPVHGPSLGRVHLADLLPQPRAEWTFDERRREPQCFYGFDLLWLDGASAACL